MFFGKKKISELSGRLDQMENNLKDVLSKNEALSSCLVKKELELKKKDTILKENQQTINKQDEQIELLNSENQSIKKRLEWLEEDQRIQTEMKIVVPQKFREVENAIRAREPFVFVHGGAGTGKSTLIQWLKRQSLIHIVLAPTGLAALNVGGMTIHKAFQFAPLDLFPKNTSPEPIPKNFLSVLKNLKANGKDTICIDEISMVRADILDAIDRTLRFQFGSMPFGGFQMVFVGDLFQLPPVVDEGVEMFFDPNKKDYRGDSHGWKSPWFLDSDVLKSYWKNITRIELDHVFRQVGSERFVNNLNQIRRYINRRKVIVELNQSLQIGVHNDNQVVIVGTNVQANSVNFQKLAQLRGKSIQYKAIKKGVFETAKEKDLPVPNDIVLKVKEFIIIVANSPNGSYVNGTTGIIYGFGPTGEVYVMTQNGPVVVQRFMWKSYRIIWNNQKKHYENIEDGFYDQIPIIPGYAITCHKAQGKTLDSVYIDVNAWESGQMYVALSRTRSPRNITMAKELTLKDFPTNKRLQDFMKAGIL